MANVKIEIGRECWWKVQIRTMAEGCRWELHDYYEKEEIARRVAEELHAPERHQESRAIKMKSPKIRKEWI